MNTDQANVLVPPLFTDASQVSDICFFLLMTHSPAYRDSSNWRSLCYLLRLHRLYGQSHLFRLRHLPHLLCFLLVSTRHVIKSQSSTVIPCLELTHLPLKPLIFSFPRPCTKLTSLITVPIVDSNVSAIFKIDRNVTEVGFCYLDSYWLEMIVCVEWSIQVWNVGHRYRTCCLLQPIDFFIFFFIFYFCEGGFFYVALGLVAVKVILYFCASMAKILTTFLTCLFRYSPKYKNV